MTVRNNIDSSHLLRTVINNIFYNNLVLLISFLVPFCPIHLRSNSNFTRAWYDHQTFSRSWASTAGPDLSRQSTGTWQTGVGHRTFLFAIGTSGNNFQSSLLFEGEARSAPLEWSNLKLFNPAWATYVRLGWRGFPYTTTSAYLCWASSVISYRRIFFRKIS